MNFKFPGRGQRNTPVAGVRGAIELVLLLPGRHAAQVRRQAAALLMRYLCGDITLVDEVCRIRGLQEELAVDRHLKELPKNKAAVEFNFKWGRNNN